MSAWQQLLEQPLTVLFTSAGNEALHGFADDLRRRAPRWRLIGTDVRADAAGLYRCDDAYVVPLRSDPDWLPTLRALCEQRRVDVVYPLSTADQDCFAQPAIQAALAPRPVVVSSPEAVALANHKVALFQALADWPALLPAFEVARDPVEAEAAMRRLARDHGAAVLKTDAGTGSRDMIFGGNPPADPAPSAGRRWVPLAELGPAIAATAHATWPRLVTAWLPGDEYCVDMLLDAGEPLAACARIRYAANGSYATHAETVAAPDVIAAAARIGHRLGLRYMNHFQLRRDASGAPRLIEINPRIPVSISLTVEAGLNLPLAAILLALGAKMPLPAPELGVHLLRHLGSVFTRHLAGRAQPGPNRDNVSPWHTHRSQPR